MENIYSDGESYTLAASHPQPPNLNFQAIGYLDNSFNEQIDFSFDGLPNPGLDNLNYQAPLEETSPMTARPPNLHDQFNDNNLHTTTTSSLQRTVPAPITMTDSTSKPATKRGRPEKKNRASVSDSTASTSRKSVGRKRSSVSSALDDQDSPEAQKRNDNLKKNAEAAAKCRQKKKQMVENLQESSRRLNSENLQLKEEQSNLLKEVDNLRVMLVATSHCDRCTINQSDILQAYIHDHFDGPMIDVDPLIGRTERSSSEQSTTSGGDSGSGSGSGSGSCSGCFSQHSPFESYTVGEHSLPVLAGQEPDYL